MASDILEEATSLQKCALDLLVGEKLGSGSTRRVFALRHDPSRVIKLEYASRVFCNVAEYELWNEVKDTDLAKFFAPVIDIDIWAGALIMARTQPITQQQFEKEVKEVPFFFTDIHWANFGRLKGKIVCHDYGYHDVLKAGVTRKPKLMKINQ